MPNNADLTDDESQSSSEEDEEAELITEDVENTFFKVFSQLKNKDPQLYKEDVNYFQNETEIQSKDPSKNKKDQLHSKKKNGSIVKNKSDGSDNFWTSEKLSKDDMFIRDYILNKKFLGGDDVDMEEELRKLKEEEEELKEEAMFEYKFNNRYEEPPDEEFVKKYPHALGIVTEDMDNKRVVKGPQSNCNSVKYEDTKKEKMKNRKRKQDDLLVNTNNVSGMSKTPNHALTNIHKNVSPTKKVKKHKDPKMEENIGKNETKIHSHSQGTNGVNNSNSGDKHLKKTKGSRLKSNSEEYEVRKEEKLNESKCNPDDVLVQTQSKKFLKNANILKQSMNMTPSKKVKQNIDLNLAEKVDINKKSKKPEVKTNKNKDYNKLSKKGNALNTLGNVKLKKNIRYKIRRKKPVLVQIPGIESAEYENSLKKQLKNHNISRDLDQKVRIETKKTLLKNKAENHENIIANGINGTVTVEQGAVNKKKRKRRRLCKKSSGESITNIHLQQIPN